MIFKNYKFEETIRVGEKYRYFKVPNKGPFVSRDGRTDGQAQSNMPLQLFKLGA